MNLLGHSGARLDFLSNEVIKSAPGLRDQAAYCMELGKEVCPTVHCVGDDSYAMERLDPVLPTSSAEIKNLLCRVKHTLEHHVWGFNVQPYKNLRFVDELYKFTRNVPWLEPDLVDRIYPSTPIHYFRIHGDPTLANTALRDGSKLIILDPIRPRGKIPALPEVDAGKMLQSAAGWEHLLLEAWPPVEDGTVPWLLRKFAEPLRPKMLLWAAVHCARILPYAKREDVRAWAAQHGQYFQSLAYEML